MSPNDLRDYLTRRPFRPFRIVTTEPVTYDIKHPDQLSVGLSSVDLPHPDDPEGYMRLSVRQIVRLITLQRVQAGLNGPA